MREEVRRGLDLIALLLALLTVSGIVMMIAGIWLNCWFWYGLIAFSAGMMSFCIGIAIGENWSPLAQSHLSRPTTIIALTLALIFALLALLGYWQSDLHIRLIQTLLQ